RRRGGRRSSVCVNGAAETAVFDPRAATAEVEVIEALLNVLDRHIGGTDAAHRRGAVALAAFSDDHLLGGLELPAVREHPAPCLCRGQAVIGSIRTLVGAFAVRAALDHVG